MVLPFKWNLFGRNFAQCHFFLEFYKNDCFFVKFYIGQYKEEKGSDGLEYSVTSNNDRLS